MRPSATAILYLLAAGERWPVATWASPFARALHQAHTLQAVAADSGGRFVIVRERGVGAATEYGIIAGKPTVVRWLERQFGGRSELRSG